MKVPAAIISALIGAADDVGADCLCVVADAKNIDLCATFIAPLAGPNIATNAISATHCPLALNCNGPIPLAAYPPAMVRAHVASALNQLIGAKENAKADSL